MQIGKLRHEISEFLRFSIPEAPAHFITHESVAEEGYRRVRIRYPCEEEDPIP
jgi:hypothetical protein